MGNKILAVVGMCGSGKSVATEVFVKAGWHRVYFGAVTFDEMARRNMPINEANERKIREEFRASGDKAIYAKLNQSKIEEGLAKGNVLVESMYSWSEYKYLKEIYGDKFEVLCIVTNAGLRRERLLTRPIRPFSIEDSTSRDYAEIEFIEKGGPIGIADYYITNNGEEEDFIAQVEAFEKEYSKK